MNGKKGTEKEGADLNLSERAEIINNSSLKENKAKKEAEPEFTGLRRQKTNFAPSKAEFKRNCLFSD